MNKTQLSPLLLAGALILAACSSAASAMAACPVSLPDPETQLYGAEDGLRVFISHDGIWDQLPHNSEGYTQKLFWKFPGYNWIEEQTPDLDMYGQQLDGDGYFERSVPATNAFADSLYGSAILTGVDFPNTGCWQITGEYRDASLSFVVWVGGQDSK